MCGGHGGSQRTHREFYVKARSQGRPAAVRVRQAYRQNFSSNTVADQGGGETVFKYRKTSLDISRTVQWDTIWSIHEIATGNLYDGNPYVAVAWDCIGIKLRFYHWEATYWKESTIQPAYDSRLW